MLAAFHPGDWRYCADVAGSMVAFFGFLIGLAQQMPKRRRKMTTDLHEQPRLFLSTRGLEDHSCHTVVLLELARRC